jgi:AraC-like DNA-binding protein
MFIQQPPSAPLAPFIDFLWYFEGDLPVTRERVLPTGAMQLVINLDADEIRWYSGPDFGVVHRIPGAALGGPYEEPVVIDTAEQRRVMGVAFKAMGAAPFLLCPANAIGGSQVPLDLLWGVDGAVLRERLLEADSPRTMLTLVDRFLRCRGAGRLCLDPAVAFAVDCLERGARVRAVVTRLGLTPKRFISRFESQVGLTPKKFSKVRRFQRALMLVRPGRDWSELATLAGYFDQSHLIHDFHEFSGAPPSAYRPRNALERNHVPLDTQ